MLTPGGRGKCWLIHAADRPNALPILGGRQPGTARRWVIPTIGNRRLADLPPQHPLARILRAAVIEGHTVPERWRTEVAEMLAAA